MTWNEALPLLIIGSALVSGLVIFCLDEKRYLTRTLLNLCGGITTLVLIAILMVGVYEGQVFESRLTLLPDIDLVFNADAMSLLFVCLSGVLWLTTTIYAVGYLEDSPNRSRFFGFFSLCVSATMGIALAGNMMTFLICYELLTLTTYPLVVHRGTKKSIRAGRIYLAYTMIGGALLLAGVVWLKAIAGALDFTSTGILSNMPELNQTHLVVIFVLLISGLGVKAALFPLHGWLPVAMAAPAPVSALLHAVAVVKAGAFGIVRVVYEVYGIEFSTELGLTTGLGVVAAITIIYGSLRALSQDDLKKRLAFSTVSQVSYIALGTAIAGPIATVGGVVHLVHQGLMKITLFFCAGNLAETLGVHRISEMNGIARRMPWTMAAFTLAALGMIGIPPLAGFVSKWYLGVGAIEADAHWVLIILALSSLLNAMYFLPILYAAWFKSPQGWPEERKLGRWETHWMLLLPPLTTAGLALFAGVLADWFISPLNWAKLIAAREYGAAAIPAAATGVTQFSVLSLVIVTPLLVAAGLSIKCLRRGLRQWLRRCLLRLAPWAAAPALVAALLPGGDTVLPWMFFGGILSLDDTARSFLLLAGLLWLAAGLSVNAHIKGINEQSRFYLFFLLAMSGNFGLIMAQDVFGFITYFTLMSLAAYGLVIFNGSREAIQAGKTYMQWVILGEVLLFAGLAWLVFNAGTSYIPELAAAPQNIWISGLLLFGFAIKAGLVPMHVWLPRAHPVAPIPASALLSGIMVKAGLLGWLQFLPFGANVIEPFQLNLGSTLILLGLTGAFLAAIAGLLQHNPKTVLAYSTISQMGVIATAVGAGLISQTQSSLLLAAIVLYALHHGLAKTALFLSVGFKPYLFIDGKSRWWLWSLIVIAALTLVGAPLTSGLLAKIALKQALTDFAWLTTLLTLTAVATTLLMLRFVDLLREQAIAASEATTQQRVQQKAQEKVQQKTQSDADTTSIPAALLWPYLLVFIPMLGLIYFVPQAQPFLSMFFSTFPSLSSPLNALAATIWTSLWPVLVGLFIFLLARKWLQRLGSIPAGDIVVVLEALLLSAKQLALTFFGWVKATLQQRQSAFVSQRESMNRNARLRFDDFRRKGRNWYSPGLVFAALLLITIILLIQ